MEAALKYIQYAESGDTPYFLYLAFGHTHAWNFASEQYWNKSERGHYGDALLEMDAALANITDHLRAQNLQKRPGHTLVFWTSDNGAPTSPHCCPVMTAFHASSLCPIRVPHHPARCPWLRLYARCGVAPPI